MTIAVLFGIWILGTNPAQASTCPGGTSADACDTNGGNLHTANDICQVSGPVITCNLTRLGDTYAATLHARTLTAVDRFDIWGIEASTSAPYCCQWGTSGITTINIVGSSQQDDFFLQDGSDDLTNDGSSLAVDVEGELEDDYILGSRCASSDYTESLHGNEDDDTIHGDAGDDNISGHGGTDYLYGEEGLDDMHGGDDIDFMEGGDGNDTMEGGDQADVMYGDDGVDTMYGYADDDYIYGGGDGDFLYGNAGMDHLFGGDGDDIIYGGDDDDVLWGEDGDDTLRGEANNDILCGHLEGSLDQLFGGGGSDQLWGADTSVTGLANNDDGGTGTDTCDSVSTGTYTSCESAFTGGFPPEECF